MSKLSTQSEYQAVFQEETEGGFSVWVPDLPGLGVSRGNFRGSYK